MCFFLLSLEFDDVVADLIFAVVNINLLDPFSRDNEIPFFVVGLHLHEVVSGIVFLTLWDQIFNFPSTLRRR